MKSKQAIRAWVWASGLMLILSAGARAQQPTVPGGGVGTNVPSLPAIDTTPPDLPKDLAERQAKMLNSARQKQLALDTQKLVSLANELKVAVDKSNKDMLSLDVIRKADEIEKLAHSVKEKMKGS